MTKAHVLVFALVGEIKFIHEFILKLATYLEDTTPLISIKGTQVGKWGNSQLQSTAVSYELWCQRHG